MTVPCVVVSLSIKNCSRLKTARMPIHAKNARSWRLKPTTSKTLKTYSLIFKANNMQAYRILSLDPRSQYLAFIRYNKETGTTEQSRFNEYVNREGWIFTINGERIA